MSPTPRICYKCGSTLPAGFDNCPNCGSPAPLSQEEIAETSSRVFRASDVAPIPPQGYGSVDRRADAAAAGAVPTVPLAAADAVPTVPIAAVAFSNPADASARPARPGQTERPERPQQPERRGPGAASGKDGWSSRTVVLISLAALVLIGVTTAIAIVFGGRGEEPSATFYPIEDIEMTANADGSGAVVADVSFGEPLGILRLGPVRSKVRYRHYGEDIDGYVSTDMLMDSAAHATLNAIVRGQALRAVPHGYQRRALIEYFRTMAAAGNDGRWRLNVPALDVYREVYTDRIVNPSSRYEDLAVVLTNGFDHRLVLFTFDADGNARVFGSRAVEGSKIHSVGVDSSAPGNIAADVRPD